MRDPSLKSCPPSATPGATVSVMWANTATAPGVGTARTARPMLLGPVQQCLAQVALILPQFPAALHTPDISTL